MKNLETVVRDIGHMIGDCLPPGLGFTLLLFEYGAKPTLQYMSSANREDMARTLRQAADMIDGGVGVGEQS